VALPSTQFESELKKLIETEMSRLMDIIAVGSAVADFSDYKYVVGQIHALSRVAASYCDEANQILSEKGK
jgi:hypothetical protein